MDYIVNGDINEEELLYLYSLTDWANKRTAKDIKTMLSNTGLYFTVRDEGRLIGFARVMTDFAYRALIDDVIVDSKYRGQGIGARLMVLIGEELRDVEEVFLGCLENMVGFYEKFGYKKANHPVMKRKLDSLN